MASRLGVSVARRPRSTTSAPSSRSCWTVAATGGGIRCRCTSQCRVACRRNRSRSRDSRPRQIASACGRIESTTVRQSPVSPTCRRTARNNPPSVRWPVAQSASRRPAAPRCGWGNRPCRDTAWTGARIPRLTSDNVTSTAVSPVPTNNTGRSGGTASSAPGRHGSATRQDPAAPGPASPDPASPGRAPSPGSWRSWPAVAQSGAAGPCPVASTRSSASTAPPDSPTIAILVPRPSRSATARSRTSLSRPGFASAAASSRSVTYAPYSRRGRKLPGSTASTRSRAQSTKSIGRSLRTDIAPAGELSRCHGSATPYARPRPGSWPGSMRVTWA